MNSSTELFSDSTMVTNGFIGESSLISEVSFSNFLATGRGSTVSSKNGFGAILGVWRVFWSAWRPLLVVDRVSARLWAGVGGVQRWSWGRNFDPKITFSNS